MASKNALWGFTQCLAIELAAYGVTVNAVAPGHVGPGTGMEKQFREKAEKLGLSWEDFEAQVLKTIPARPLVRAGRRRGGGRLCRFAGGVLRHRRADQRDRRLHRLRHRASEGGGMSKDLRAGGLDRRHGRGHSEARLLDAVGCADDPAVSLHLPQRGGADARLAHHRGRRRARPAAAARADKRCGARAYLQDERHRMARAVRRVERFGRLPAARSRTSPAPIRPISSSPPMSASRTAARCTASRKSSASRSSSIAATSSSAPSPGTASTS